MKIIRNTKKVMIAELNPGDCFLYENELYMIGDFGGLHYACNLKSGKIKMSDPIIMVKKVDVEVHLDE